MAEVRQLRDPPLTDIPGRLRWLADKLAANTMPESALVYLIGENGDVIGYNYGVALGTFETIGILHTVATTTVVSQMEED